jgi:hypothetical protein
VLHVPPAAGVGSLRQVSDLGHHYVLMVHVRSWVAVSPASASVAVPASAVVTVHVTVLAGAVPAARPPVMVIGDALVNEAGATGPSLSAEEPALVPCAHAMLTVKVPSEHRLPVPDWAPCSPEVHVPAVTVNVLAGCVLVLAKVTVVAALAPGTIDRFASPLSPYLLIEVHVYAPLTPEVDAHVVEIPAAFGPVSTNMGAWALPASFPRFVTLAVNPESDPLTLEARMATAAMLPIHTRGTNRRRFA